jgi:hypothetical protein
MATVHMTLGVNDQRRAAQMTARTPHRKAVVGLSEYRVPLAYQDEIDGTEYVRWSSGTVAVVSASWKSPRAMNNHFFSLIEARVRRLMAKAALATVLDVLGDVEEDVDALGPDVEVQPPWQHAPPPTSRHVLATVMSPIVPAAPPLLLAA